MALASLVIADYNTAEMRFQYLNSSFKKNVKEDAKIIASKAKALKSRVGQRDKLRSDYGNWYIMRGANNLLFAACVGEDYPERVAYGLIQKADTLIQEKPTKDAGMEQKIKLLQKQLLALCEKYKDSSIDKVKQAQLATEELRQQLNKGVKNLIGNKENLQQMNDKAALMKNYAKSFEKSATEFEKAACWRKWRFFILAGVVLMISFMAAGLIIYCRTH